MDLSYGAELEGFRSQVQGFLKDNWPLTGDDAELSTAEQHALFREGGQIETTVAGEPRMRAVARVTLLIPWVDFDAVAGCGSSTPRCAREPCGRGSVE